MEICIARDTLVFYLKIMVKLSKEKTFYKLNPTKKTGGSDMRKHLKNHLSIGVLFFLLSLLIFEVMDSPHPFIASLIVAFVAFEISVYYFFQKEKKVSKLSL